MSSILLQLCNWSESNWRNNNKTVIFKHFLYDRCFHVAIAIFLLLIIKQKLIEGNYAAKLRFDQFSDTGTRLIPTFRESRNGGNQGQPSPFLQEEKSGLWSTVCGLYDFPLRGWPCSMSQATTPVPDHPEDSQFFESIVLFMEWWGYELRRKKQRLVLFSIYSRKAHAFIRRNEVVAPTTTEKHCCMGKSWEHLPAPEAQSC